VLPFAPEFEGRVAAERIPDGFFHIVAARVQSGLFVPGVRARAQYEVTRVSADSLAFRASDLWTAANVGLNEVELQRDGAGTIRYRVRFRKWTLYAVVLCGGIAVLLALGWALGIRRSPADQPLGDILFWGNIAFWGLAWPWILTALHRKPAARCLEGILRQELQATTATTPAR